MTTNQSDADEAPEEAAEAPVDDAEATADAADAPADGTAERAQRFAELVGAESWTADHGLAKIRVSNEQWVGAVSTAHKNGMPFFSFLSAVDWSRDVAVGEPLADEDVDERFELMVRLSTLSNDDSITIVTDLDKANPAIDSLTPVLPGANWHEREAAEMFGIDFRGHPNPKKLYLPDAFEGFPLRKSFPLLSREVKPWPGMVDVEAMPESAGSPSTENPEATDGVADDAAEGGVSDADD